MSGLFGHVLRKFLWVAVGASSLGTSIAAPLNFSGHPLTVLVPSSVGGNTDALARIVGRYLPLYLPGRPTTIYQNMPTGGGITAVNVFAKQTKPDGLTILAGSASNLDPTQLRNPAVQYDSKKLLMFGGFPSPTSLVILRKAALDQFNDRSKKPAIMGDVSADRTTDQMATWGPRYLGWNVHWVLGYPGTSDLVLAIRRGEIDMMVTYGDALLDQFRKDGAFLFPAQTGEPRAGRMEPGLRFPDVPLFSSLVRPKLRSPEEIKAFEAWEVISRAGKWFALPPGADPEIVSIYREAFQKMIASKEFIADATVVLGGNYPVATGAEVQAEAVATASVGTEELAFFEDLRKSVGIQAATPIK